MDDKKDGGASERGEDTHAQSHAHDTFCETRGSKDTEDERRKLKHKNRNRLVDPWSTP